MALLILQVLFMGQAKCKLYKCKNTQAWNITVQQIRSSCGCGFFFFLIIFPLLSQKSFLKFASIEEEKCWLVLEGKLAKNCEVVGNLRSCLEILCGAGAI